MTAGLAERVLERLCRFKFAEGARLRDVVADYLAAVAQASGIEIWSQIVPLSAGDAPTFTLVGDYRDGRPRHPAAPVLCALAEVEGRAAGRNLAHVAVREFPLNDLGLTPRLIVVYDSAEGISAHERGLLEDGLVRLVADHLAQRYRSEQDAVIAQSTASKDLTSFYHRCITNVVIPNYHFQAASFFYFENKTESLILGGTTGIRRQSDFNLKRSDIRYFSDGKSFTARCFRDGLVVIEDERAGSLTVNTYGEDVETVRSRLYLPLKAKTRLGADTDVVGVLRGVNVNGDSGHHPLTVLELARLEFLADTIGALTRRYVRTLSILHDQERATHGYSTDLLTIKLAASTISKCLSRIDAEGKSVIEANAIREIGFRTHDILAIQDNMAQQLITVGRQSNAELRPLAADRDLCVQPYTTIFLRLLAAKKGMSQCYNRQELRVLSGGSNRFDESFKEIPPLNITIGALYLAVRNITENAIKYTPKVDVPTLDITWALAGDQVEFSFRDYGIGIPPADVRYLTREGFRGLSAQHLQLRGNGLGLAVTRSVLREAGGELQYAAPNDDMPGSIFKISVPATKGG